MQSGTVADIAAVVDNCAVALQEAEEMAGFRPTQVVIGIAGELVKGFTTTLTQERKKPEVADHRRRAGQAHRQRPARGAPGGRAVDHLGDRPAARRRPARPQRDRRRVDRRLRADQPGRASRAATSRSGSSTRSRRWSTSGALQSVASQLDLELLEVVAEPYAVARVLGAGAGAPGRARCSSTSAAARPTSRSSARAASRARGCSRSAGGRSRSRSPTGSTCRSRAPSALKVDYARGLADRRARRRSREIVGRRRRGLGRGRGARDGGARRGRDAAVADPPVRRRVAPARDPRGARRGAVLEAAAVRPTARGRR